MIRFTKNAKHAQRILRKIVTPLEMSFDVESLENRCMLAGDSFDWSSLNVETIESVNRSVDIDGDTMVVGSPGGNSSLEHATVYQRDSNGQWSEQATLTGSSANQTGYSSDDFGWEVAIDGDTIVIGSPGDRGINDDAHLAGAAYVFTRSGSTWTERTILYPSDAEQGDEFGFDVAIEGNTIVVGAVAKDNYDGGGYIFTGSGANWTESFKVDGEDAVFGQFVAISGNTAAFSAQGVNSVFVYTKGANGSWSSQDTIQQPANDQESFGFNVAIDGDYLVSGATPDEGNGSAYVYKRTGNNWSEVDVLRENDGDPDHFFGGDVAIQGDTILVSASEFGTGNEEAAGAFYIYQDNGNDDWQLIDQVKSPNPMEFGYFGGDLAMDNGTIATLDYNIFTFQAELGDPPQPQDPQVTAELVNGALLVTGTDLNDKIKVLQKTDTVTVKATKFSQSFNVANFDRIVINAGDGDDSVTVSPKIAIRAWISGESRQ